MSTQTILVESQTHNAQEIPLDNESIQSIEHPRTATTALESWNNPKRNVVKYFGTNWSFFVMGVNDAAIGALIPYVEQYYDISYTIVSFVFLAPLAGYLLAAVLNNKVHMMFGQKGVAIIAPCCRLITYICVCVHPPFPVIPVVYVLNGFGSGLVDAAWNAWVGNMDKANQLLGILNGAYGLGAAVAPLVATSMIVKSGLPWYSFYYVLIGAAFSELVIGAAAFWKDTGTLYREHNQSIDETSRTKQALRHQVTWVCSFYILIYAGIEVSIGGWLVTFMIRVRQAEPYSAGLTATGFWLGLTLGRVTLGFVTEWIGEKLSTAIYIGICIGLELLFWLVPSFLSSAICAAFLGYFLGPMMCTAIVIAAKVLPRRIHVTAIGFIAAFGMGGGSVLPFVVGAIAEARGVQVLQPIVLALLVVALILWCCLPGGFTKKGLEEAQSGREEGRNSTVLENLGFNPERVRKRLNRS